LVALFQFAAGLGNPMIESHPMVFDELLEMTAGQVGVLSAQKNIQAMPDGLRLDAKPKVRGALEVVFGHSPRAVRIVSAGGHVPHL
jgi:hypothetical protein